MVDIKAIQDIFLSPVNLRRDVRDSLKEYFSTYLKPDMAIYDIGCGDKPFAPFLKDKVKEHIGVDIEDGFYDSSHIDMVGTAYEVPAPDGSADAVISSQVIEHLEKPVDAILETHRLLKPSGLLFLSFPFMYPIHAAPHDYCRYTEFSMDKMLDDNGFELLEKRTIGGFWYCIAMFSGIYLSSFNRGAIKYIYIVPFISWIAKSILRLLHELEGMGLQLLNKDKDHFRKSWVVNYVLVAKKKA